MVQKIMSPFSGDLAKPMPRRKRVYTGLLNRGDGNEDKGWDREFTRRFLLLFDFYGIDPNTPRALSTLAYKLAVHLVPGLREKPPERRGRKRIDNSPAAIQARRELKKQYDAFKADRPTLSEDRICALLVNKMAKEPTTYRLHGKSPRTLRRQLATARLEERRESISLPAFLGITDPASKSILDALVRSSQVSSGYVGVGTRLLTEGMRFFEEAEKPITKVGAPPEAEPQ